MHSGYMSGCARGVAAADGTQRGALLVVVCPYVGWLPHCGSGFGTVCPVLGGYELFCGRIDLLSWLFVVICGVLEFVGKGHSRVGCMACRGSQMSLWKLDPRRLGFRGSC